jgi:hypothetical protein
VLGHVSLATCLPQAQTGGFGERRISAGYLRQKICGKSANIAYLRSLNTSKHIDFVMAGAAGLEPATYGFGDREIACENRPLISLRHRFATTNWPELN